MICPHCSEAVFRATPDAEKLKARTTMLVLHKSGGVEINCARCGHGVLLPLQLSDGPFELKKASSDAKRLVIRKGA